MKKLNFEELERQLNTVSAAQGKKLQGGSYGDFDLVGADAQHANMVDHNVATDLFGDEHIGMVFPADNDLDICLVEDFIDDNGEGDQLEDFIISDVDTIGEVELEVEINEACFAAGG